MKCHLVTEERLQQLMDDRLPLNADAALNAHLARCQRCSAVRRDFAVLDALFATNSIEPLAAAPRHSAVHLAGRWGLATAAAVMLASLITLSASTEHATEGQDIPPFAVSASPGAPPAAAIAEAQGQSAQPRDGSSAESGDPARDAGAFPVDDLLAFLSTSSEATSVASPIVGANSARLHWVRPVSGGLKPITDSMEAALDALRSTLPGGGSTARS